MSLSVLGAGAFGTALAAVLAQDKRPVTVWARDSATVDAINRNKESPRLPGLPLPETVLASGDLAQAAQADVVLLAVPMQTLRGVLEQIADPLVGRALVACCKGLDLHSLNGPTEVIHAVKPDARPALMTGPSFAADIARGRPTALTLACAHDALGKALQEQLSTSTLRLYRTTDVCGAELGGALKNVVAIACGACIGAGLGESARAAVMTRGFAEITRLSTRLGALPQTLSGLSGFGDLALTCMSEQSRNTRFGMALGADVATDGTQTVEGVKTAQAVVALAERLGIEMPICQTVCALCEGHLSVAEAMQDLLTRPLKEE